MSDKKVWLITGAARGFGRRWATAALERGDNVVATARDTAALDPLVAQFGDAILPLKLDVTDRAATFAVVERAVAAFGRLDFVLSNAGYGYQGAVEEISEVEARQQMDTNFFGTMWLTQAVLPIMRKQKSGHVLAVSSVLGQFSVPNFGIYSASKFALEGLFDALSQEVSGFGIRTTLIEPAGYATDFANSSSAKFPTNPLPAYEPVREFLKKAFEDSVPGNPAATAVAIMKLVDSTNPPQRLLLGGEALAQVKGVYQSRIATWEEWSDVTAAAQG